MQPEQNTDAGAGYARGKELVLTVLSDDGTPETVIGVEILHMFARPSFSVAMVVSIVRTDPDIVATQEMLVLKLFDRRMACSLRSRHGAQPWSQAVEDEYVDAVRRRTVAKHYAKGRTMATPCFCGGVHDPADDAGASTRTKAPGEDEAVLAGKMDAYYATETAAYEALAVLQGTSVPIMYTRVSLSIRPPGTHLAPGDCAFLDVKGVLLQYLDGVPLGAMHQYLPRDAWNPTIGKVRSIVASYRDLGVINDDLHPGNIIVTRDPDDPDGWRPWIIDLGHCRLRTTESDIVWLFEQLRAAEDTQFVSSLFHTFHRARLGHTLPLDHKDPRWAVVNNYLRSASPETIAALRRERPTFDAYCEEFFSGKYTYEF